MGRAAIFIRGMIFSLIKAGRVEIRETVESDDGGETDISTFSELVVGIFRAHEDSVFGARYFGLPPVSLAFVDLLACGIVTKWLHVVFIFMSGADSLLQYRLHVSPSHKLDTKTGLRCSSSTKPPTGPSAPSALQT
jgi:hypothetical protein